MITPNFIDEIIRAYEVDNPALEYDLKVAQRQWAADLESYQVLESRYKSTVENISVWVKHATEEIGHVAKTRRMRSE